MNKEDSAYRYLRHHAIFVLQVRGFCYERVVKCVEEALMYLPLDAGILDVADTAHAWTLKEIDGYRLAGPAAKRCEIPRCGGL